MRYYEALGVEPKLALDSEDLKRRFYDLSRQWHPDRFARASAGEQQKALDMTAVLNDAVRTLKDPISRAEYLLEESGLGPSKGAPAELLEEVFELNMALDELRGGDESVRGQLTEARARFVAMRDEIDTGLAAMFARYDSAPAQPILSEIRAALDRRRYISNLIRDVDKESGKEITQGTHQGIM
jgi:molecular chaperone HscB